MGMELLHPTEGEPGFFRSAFGIVFMGIGAITIVGVLIAFSQSQ
jgi:hypothetical protein